MKRHILILLCLLLAIAPSHAAFTIHRGVNISHWLSQSTVRGKERAENFTEKDVAFIASLGFDHLRIPIDEVQMFTEDGQKEAEAFQLLHNALRWCRKYKMRAVVDLHILRSHNFNAEVKPLFTDPAAQEAFYECWRKISSELKRYSNSWVAYEMMNEPVADDAETWNVIVNRCAAEVRKLEPKRTLVIGSNEWQVFHTVKDLRIPENDPNVIISFHYYIPMPLTHYRASWSGVGKYTGPVHYPGQVVAKEDLDKMGVDFATKYDWFTRQYSSAESMGLHFDEVLKQAAKYGVKVYCGEYGCINNTPEEDRNRWFSDMDEQFEARGIARAVWDYRGGFGIIKNGFPDEHMIRILTGKMRIKQIK